MSFNSSWKVEIWHVGSLYVRLQRRTNRDNCGTYTYIAFDRFTCTNQSVCFLCAVSGLSGELMASRRDKCVNGWRNWTRSKKNLLRSQRRTHQPNWIGRILRRVHQAIGARQRILACQSRQPAGRETNVLKYWKYQSQDPGLAKLAEIVLALPGTQVSVKLAFSHLPLVITNRRTNLISQTIDDIFMVKFNAYQTPKWLFNKTSVANMSIFGGRLPEFRPCSRLPAGSPNLPEFQYNE